MALEYLLIFRGLFFVVQDLVHIHFADGLKLGHAGLCPLGLCHEVSVRWIPEGPFLGLDPLYEMGPKPLFVFLALPEGGRLGTLSPAVARLCCWGSAVYGNEHHWEVYPVRFRCRVFIKSGGHALFVYGQPMRRCHAGKNRGRLFLQRLNIAAVIIQI